MRRGFRAPGWAEQDPADWWSALGASVRGAVAAAGVDAARVLAIGTTTTCCSVVALDAAGDAIRPALIWMDVRADAEAAEVLATGDAATEVNSGGRGPVSAEWMVPKALWLARHEPDAFFRAVTVCEYQDYLNLHLTGAALREPQQRVLPLAFLHHARERRCHCWRRWACRRWRRSGRRRCWRRVTLWAA